MDAMPSRRPDPCPQHPGSRHVLTKIRKPYPHLSGFRGQPAVIQHRCGEPGCSEGLGWLELDDGVPKNSGPGICQEKSVMGPIERREHRSNITSLMAATCTFGFIAWIISMLAVVAITGESWGTPHAILTGTIIVITTATLGGLARLMRTGPWPQEATPKGM